ncbi:MAG: molybdenum cofactor biosynthesis protein MoaE [Bryobacteraceae bacterium]
MQVRVLFFGMLRELAGGAEQRLDVADGATMGDVFEACAARFPRMREMASSIVLARNQEFSRPGDAVREGDEIALLPPVSGGSGAFLRQSNESGNFFALTRQPIDVRKLAALALRGEDGAVVTFDGVARNNTGGRRTRCLEYECYEPMALKVMAEIGRELAAGFDIGHIGIVHRLGRVLIGETSVAIVVTAPHRQAAFAAALEAVDQLKRRVPVWKREYFEDGEVWVEGEWDGSVPKAAP